MRLHDLVQTIRGDLRFDTVRGSLIRSAGLTAGVKIGGIALAFLASLLYARVLGPHDYGIYAYVMAWTAILTVVASLGLPQYLIREGAHAPGTWPRMRAWADSRVVITGALAGLCMLFAAALSIGSISPWMFVIVAPLPVVNGLASIRSALLQTHGKIFQSQWPNLLAAPALVLGVLTIAWAWKGALTAPDLLVVTLIAAFVPLLINGRQLRRNTVASIADDLRLNLRDALPFIWINALFLINTRADLLVLGTLRGPSEAGVYAVACRAAELIPFFMTVANMVVGPRVSALYRVGNQAQLQRLATAVVRRLAVVTLPLALVLIITAQPLVTLLYGTRYAEAAIVLQILGTAQLFSISAGILGILLNMTEHAAASAKVFGFSAGISVILSVLLVPGYGTVGAAIASATSIVACTLMRWYLVRRHLGLRPSLFGC